MNTCKTCKWWEQITRDRGQCRRFPPRKNRKGVNAYGESEAPVWPVTRITDYCGEHQPKEAKE